MTTILGLNDEKLSVTVLVADRQGTYFNEKGFPEEKALSRKLWRAKDNSFCFGHAGFRDNEFYDFMAGFSEGKYDLEKIISKKYFPELRKLNMKRMGKKLPDINNLSGLILATRFNSESKLHLCYPLGEVENKEWASIGSGSEKVTEYLNAKRIIFEARDYKKQSNDIYELIRTGLEAVRRAQNQDVYSSGLDLMICFSEAIVDYEKEFSDKFNESLERFKSNYKYSELTSKDYDTIRKNLKSL